MEPRRDARQDRCDNPPSGPATDSHREDHSVALHSKGRDAVDDLGPTDGVRLFRTRRLHCGPSHEHTDGPDEKKKDLALVHHDVYGFGAGRILIEPLGSCHRSTPVPSLPLPTQRPQRPIRRNNSSMNCAHPHIGCAPARNQCSIHCSEAAADRRSALSLPTFHSSRSVSAGSMRVARRA